MAIPFIIVLYSCLVSLLKPQIKQTVCTTTVQMSLFVFNINPIFKQCIYHLRMHSQFLIWLKQSWDQCVLQSPLVKQVLATKTLTQFESQLIVSGKKD